MVDDIFDSAINKEEARHDEAALKFHGDIYEIHSGHTFRDEDYPIFDLVMDLFAESLFAIGSWLFMDLQNIMKRKAGVLLFSLGSLFTFVNDSCRLKHSYDNDRLSLT